MTNEKDPVGSELDRHFATQKIARITREIEFTSDQVGSWSRWLTASLLAINGGGALATLNQAKVGDFSWCAGALFASGIIFALLSGTLLQELYNRRIGPVLECDEYWSEVKFTGARDNSREEVLDKQLKKVLRFSWVAPSLGWMSGILFLVGCYFLAANVTR